MNRYLVFDTSIIIPCLVHDGHAGLFKTALRRGMALLPAPVLHELYAGTRSQSDKNDVDRIYGSFKQIDGILTPSEEDWAFSGIYMARYIRSHGKVDPKDHLTDLLIAILASNAGAPLVTQNKKDMLRWQKILKGSGKNLVLYPAEQFLF
jgi:predicted nucleic acid-binding protein